MSTFDTTGIGAKLLKKQHKNLLESRTIYDSSWIAYPISGVQGIKITVYLILNERYFVLSIKDKTQE